MTSLILENNAGLLRETLKHFPPKDLKNGLALLAERGDVEVHRSWVEHLRQDSIHHEWLYEKRFIYRQAMLAIDWNQVTMLTHLNEFYQFEPIDIQTLIQGLDMSHLMVGKQEKNECYFWLQAQSEKDKLQQLTQKHAPKHIRSTTTKKRM